jgi:hypothetical protein
MRVAAGLPRYTEREAARRRANDVTRSKQRVKSKYADFSARVDAIKLAQGCADCGYRTHPAALEFDHLEPGEKRFGIARMAWYTWSDVVAEMAKCEIVCANCHAIRTANRRLL